MYKFSQDYSFHSRIQAPRQNVFKFLESIECIKQWWDNPVAGHAHEGGNIQFGFKNSNDYCIMNVDNIHHPSRVQWSVIKDTGYQGEWEGTTIIFELLRIDSMSCCLDFYHVGLTPYLISYEDCKKGWEYFLNNLISASEMDFNQNTTQASEVSLLPTASVDLCS